MKLQAILLTLFVGTASVSQLHADNTITKVLLVEFLLDHPRKPVNFFSLGKEESYTSGKGRVTYTNNDGVIEITCIEQGLPEILSDSQLEARKCEHDGVFGTFMTDKFTSTSSSFVPDKHNKNLITETVTISTKIDTAFYKNLKMVRKAEKICAGT